MTNHNDPLKDDFTLDLDGTCAAAAKRYKDNAELINRHIKDFIEPYEETAKHCGSDEEAFWLVMKNEFEVGCTCDIIKKMSKELEGKITTKDLCFALCYSYMLFRTARFEGMEIAKKMIDTLKKLEGEGNDS